jgi:hypothetical protein
MRATWPAQAPNYSVLSSLQQLPPNILLSTLFSNTLNLHSSLSVKDQVPNPYKTAGEIIVFYILIFKVLEKRH